MSRRVLNRVVKKNSRRHCFHFDYYRNRCGSNKFSKRTIVPKKNLGVEGPERAPTTLLCSASNKRKNATQQRGRYFAVFRDERKLLTLLGQQSMGKPDTSSGYRRKLRFVYYRILPKLISVLKYPTDQWSIRCLERYYYDELNLVHRNKNRPRVDRLKCRLVLYQTWEDSSHQAKLY